MPRPRQPAALEAIQSRRPEAIPAILAAGEGWAAANASRQLCLLDGHGRAGADVAALYVEARGVYASIAGVDPWPASRNANAYAGPLAVIAHPPCGPWGRYAHLCEQDPACALHAVDHVRRWGGVLEHPAESKLWAVAELPRPGEACDGFGGWTLAVNQCDFGHPAPKPTWLYIAGATPAEIPDLPPPLAELPAGRVEYLSKRRRAATPPAFARWLVEAARRCRRA